MGIFNARVSSFRVLITQYLGLQTVRNFLCVHFCATQVTLHSYQRLFQLYSVGTKHIASPCLTLFWDSLLATAHRELSNVVAQLLETHQGGVLALNSTTYYTVSTTLFICSSRAWIEEALLGTEGQLPVR